MSGRGKQFLNWKRRFNISAQTEPHFVGGAAGNFEPPLPFLAREL